MEKVKQGIYFYRGLLLLALLCISFLAAPVFQQPAFAKERAVSQEARNFLNRMSDYLAEVAEVTRPSVVNISTTTIVSMKESPYGELFNDPLFRKFFGEQHPGFPEKFKSTALGSGVIVSADGYVLTNYHVVKNASEISVKLYDKREFKGKVIGFDPQTDISVVKIEARDLPAIKVGESSKLKAGDVVLAIGNPFALNQTITMGIVSAVGRANIGISAYEDYIQTDAAINPGNSGGALVNSSGELVGINTAIFSTSGGYMGIGFAIPSDIANSVAESIIKHGKVIRGWLGVMIQDLTPELAKSFNLTQEQGVLVTDVVGDGPADKAGMKRGDLIIAYEGKAVESSTSLRNMVARAAPGTAVNLKIIREGKELTLRVTLGELPETVATGKAEYNNVLKGVHVQEITPDLRGSLNIPASVKGVLVVNVDEDSPASDAVTKNDVIIEINRKAVNSVKAYDEAVSKIGANDTVLLLVYRSGGYLYVTIKP